MFQLLGKKLSETRTKRGLSVDEVAHATKLRPDKIIALETGDFSSFPSNAYARGFLLIYGRFLNLDVELEAGTLDTTNRINIADYQYLSNPNEPRPEPETPLPDLSRRKKPSLVPLFAAFGVTALVIFCFTLYVNWQRIHPNTSSKDKGAETAVAALPNAPESLPQTDSAATPTVDAAGLESPLAATPHSIPVAPAVATPAAEEPGAPDPVAMPPRPLVSDREFLGGAATPADATPPVPAPPAVARAIEPPVPVPNPDRDLITSLPVQMNEVEVAVAKTTWVKIRKDDPASTPIFEDYLYPHTRGLKLKGTRFFIEARDSTAVEIRKNGDPIAYQSPGVTVQ